MKKVVFITGASSGIGLLTAMRAAAEGHRVIAGIRNREKRKHVIEKAEACGVRERLELVPLDVTEPEQVKDAVRLALDTHGRIDVLINNAGYARGGFAEELPVSDYRAQFETNVFGLMETTRRVIPHMRERKSGTIINISSVSGRIGFPAMSPYVASKFAVEGYSECLRLELLPHGVYVSLIEPGPYKTGIWDRALQEIKDEPSAYDAWKRKLLSHVEHTKENAEDPGEVAEVILRIIRSKRPGFRYPVGRKTKWSLALKALLPWRMLEKAVTKQMDA